MGIDTRVSSLEEKDGVKYEVLHEGRTKTEILNKQYILLRLEPHTFRLMVKETPGPNGRALEPVRRPTHIDLHEQSIWVLVSPRVIAAAHKPEGRAVSVTLPAHLGNRQGPQ